MRIKSLKLIPISQNVIISVKFLLPGLPGSFIFLFDNIKLSWVYFISHLPKES